MFSPIDRDKANNPSLKLKYRQAGRRLRRQGVDPIEGTMTYIPNMSSKRSKKGGSSGQVGRKARRSKRWPAGIKPRSKAI